MEQRIEVVDEHGKRLVAIVTHAWFGREIVWSAEIEGMVLSVPITGTAGDERSITAALQATVLRWGIAASPVRP